VRQLPAADHLGDDAQRVQDADVGSRRRLRLALRRLPERQRAQEEMTADDILLSFQIIAITSDAEPAYLTSLEIAVELKRRFDYVIDTGELRKKMHESPLVGFRDYGCSLSKDEKEWDWGVAGGSYRYWNEIAQIMAGKDRKAKK
jgi:hypothetical protein